MSVPSFAPKCPNHGAPLEGLPFPLPEKGTGKCPVSGVDFEFNVSIDESRTIQDKNGNITKALAWETRGNE